MYSEILAILSTQRILYHNVRQSEGSLYVELSVEARPNSKKERIEVMSDGALKICFREKPVEGKANEALTRLLAKGIGIAASCVQLVRGETSKHKVIAIYWSTTPGKGVDYFAQKLKAFIESMS